MSGWLSRSLITLLAQAGAAAPSSPAAAPADNTLVLWALVALAIAVVLYVLEVFVPSGGVLGFCATVAVIVAIGLLFKVNTTLGLIGAIVCLAALPILFMAVVKIWPDTPIGRLLTLGGNDEIAAIAAASAQAPPGWPSVGDRGRALTDLRPVGTCLIGDHRLDCLAATGVIRAGENVRVVSADGMQIKVRTDDSA